MSTPRRLLNGRSAELLRLFLLLLILGGGPTQLAAQGTMARVQLLHSAPGLSERTVDVRIQVQGGPQDRLLVDNLAYHTPTAFLDVTAGQPIRFVVCEENSQSIADSLAEPTDFNSLTAGQAHVVTLMGVDEESQYDYNTYANTFSLPTDSITNSAPLRFYLKRNAREEASQPNRVALQMVHASPDIPSLTARINNLRSGEDTLAYVGYGEYSDYISLKPKLYLFDLALDFGFGPQRLHVFTLDLRGMGGQAVTAASTGFIRANNQPGGTAQLTQIPYDTVRGVKTSMPISAYLQFIHNAPDTAIPTLDLYVEGERYANDIPYEGASNPNLFYEFPRMYDANMMDIQVVPGDAPDASNPLLDTTISTGSQETSYLMATGFVSDTSELTLNPERISKQFALVHDKIGGRPGLQIPEQAIYSVMHGIHDLESVDMNLDGQFVEDYQNLPYKLAAPFGFPFIQIDTLTDLDTSHTMTFRRNDGPSLLEFTLDPDSLMLADNKHAVFFLSGFLDPEANNRPGEGPQLWMALPRGRTVNVGANSAVVQAEAPRRERSISVRTYPVPARRHLHWRFRLHTPRQAQLALYNLRGQRVRSLHRNRLGPGQQTLGLDVSELPAGVYSYRLRLGDHAANGKVVIRH